MGARTVIKRAQNQGVTPVRTVLVSTGEGFAMEVDSREVGEWRAQGLDVVIMEFAPVQGVSLVKATDRPVPAGVVCQPSEWELDRRRSRVGGDLPYAWMLGGNDPDSLADWFALACRGV